MLVYIGFFVGFVILIKGADFLVEGASSIAKRFHISDLIIGLTIVSLGTSLPELLVNVMASFRGSSEIGIGNVLGSNIANILLVLGVSAAIYPIPVTRNTMFIEIPFSLTATLLVGFLANVSIFHLKAQEDGAILVISRGDGYILLFFFMLFVGYIYIYARDKQQAVINPEMHPHVEPVLKSVGLILLGCVGLFFGGKWVVDGAIALAGFFGLSESFIGLTVVALGTSLPELVTSVMAVMKKNTEIAIGNVVGSNIFNLLWILGLSAIIKPLPFDVINNADILTIIGSSTLLLLAVAVGKRAVISRWEGWLFVIAYILYIVFLFIRG
jgi:cation:H+ antiporter